MRSDAARRREDQGGVRAAAPRDVPPAHRLPAEQGGRAGVSPGRRGRRRWRRRGGADRRGVAPGYVWSWRIEAGGRDTVARPLPLAVRALAAAIAAALDAAHAPRPASAGLILSDDSEL